MRPLTAQLTATVVLIVAATIGLVGAFGYWAMLQVDAQAMERQSRFMARSIQGQMDRLPREQESSAVWDDAVVNVRAGNQEWMEENLGLWMGTYFGHDRVFILDPEDAPIHAMIDEQTVDADRYLAYQPALRDLIGEQRSAMAGVSLDLDDSTPAVTEISTTDMVMIDDLPAIVSVRPIVPSSEQVTQLPGTEYLHVAIQLVDAALAGAIAEPFELSNVRLIADGELAPVATSIPLTNCSGRILGVLGWDGYRPGSQVIRETAPAALLGLGTALGLIVWLLRRLRRSSSLLQISEAQAQFLAFHDALTGLPNRALFEDRLDRALVQVRRSGRWMALHSIDLDRFKNVNDTLGHAAGDELVRQVSARLQRLVRESDTVARLGGDEFAVVQVDIGGENEAERLAERIIIELTREFDLAGEPAFVSASIGIVVSRAEQTSTHDIMRKADIALYEAKNKGRSRYEVFAGDMDDVVRRRRTIEGDLRRALETGSQLRVAYQPLFAVDGKTMLGAEALLRWDHPIHGAMSPELFIAIAEERGLIEPLGEFVLREACSFTAASSLPWVAVNISPVQFRNPRFLQKVLQVVASTGLSPTRLQLEITEGILLENSDLLDSTLSALRSAGIKIALDDFGTGYSLMSYLRRYKIDKLKIDRSFINQLGASLDSDAIVRAMITLARSMRLEVTAEGVETTQQRDHLAAIGCHELQGYLMSKPIGPQQLLAIMASAAAGPSTGTALPS